MVKVKYLILGGGPAGLTIANKLKDRGEKSLLLIEKENTAGGLCRSTDVDGAPFDIGGGHFLDIRRPEVNEYLFRFMDVSEWNIFERDSRIDMGFASVSHPLEANIWQFPEDKQREYLDSISKAGCNNNIPMPERFVDWIRWKLGDKIADDYMIPYNTKMFADELNELGTYWLDKLPNVNYEDTLASCREHKAYGSQPGHASFYYPKKYGYGELFLRMADKLKASYEGSLSAVSIDVSNREVTLSDGTKICADCIVTTVPWQSFESVTGLSDEAVDSISHLKHSSIETRYVPEKLDTSAQWIYIPDPDKPYHRILVRSNFANSYDDVRTDGKYTSRGYWLETRLERVHMYEKSDTFTYFNEYAYPLNTIDKPAIMDNLLNKCAACKVYGLGRWGEHSHYNSDVVVSRAMLLASKI